jgi:hypothetical protein
MENISSSEHVIKHKSFFILSAIDKGWVVKKRNNKYIFTKKHGGNKEIFSDAFLQRFMEENIDLNK